MEEDKEEEEEEEEEEKEKEEKEEEGEGEEEKDFKTFSEVLKTNHEGHYIVVFKGGETGRNYAIFFLAE